LIKRKHYFYNVGRFLLKTFKKKHRQKMEKPKKKENKLWVSTPNKDINLELAQLFDLR